MSQPDYEEEVPAEEFDNTVPIGQGEGGPSKEEVREAARELAEQEEGRDPLLTPDDMETAVGELEEELFAEKAEQGLDQLEGPQIEAVMKEEVEADEAPDEES